MNTIANPTKVILSVNNYRDLRRLRVTRKHHFTFINNIHPILLGMSMFVFNNSTIRVNSRRALNRKISCVDKKRKKTADLIEIRPRTVYDINYGY